MGYEVLETNSGNPDFIKLIKLLDEDLEGRYGELQKQYNAFNKVDYIKDVVIVYTDETPVACGAFKELDGCSVELKRIFVMKEFRQQGLGKLIVKALEELALKKSYADALLETGVKQQEAINLYQKLGYVIIPNYGPYAENENSVCMKKALRKVI